MDINEQDVRDEFKDAQGQAQMLNQQQGGGPGISDQDAVGGSSGEGGYGNAQNQSFHQGQNDGPDSGPPKTVTRELSRGERFDMEQGGGRSDDAVDFEEELKEDQRAHQDHGQGFVASQGDADEGAVTEGQQP